jgi:succinate dehydrogenase / fumarate reductase, membrane anchor subunit
VRTRSSGVKAWWLQRASAVYMLFFMLFVLGSVCLHPPRTYPEWHGWFGRSSVSIAALVFFAALLSHMWVGLHDVLLDYARPAELRRVLLGLVALGLLGMAAWVLHIFLPLLQA